MQLEAQYRTIKNSLRCSACVCVCVCVAVWVCVWCVLRPEIGSLIETRIYQKERKKSWVVALFPHTKSFLGSVRKLLVSVDALYTPKVRRTPLRHPSNGSYEKFPYYIMNPPNPKPSLRFSLANEHSQATKCSFLILAIACFPSKLSQPEWLVYILP